MNLHDVQSAESQLLRYLRFRYPPTGGFTEWTELGNDRYTYMWGGELHELHRTSTVYEREMRIAIEQGEFR